MRRLLLVYCLLAVVPACAPAADVPTATARVLLVGDVMLGRGVAGAVASDGDEVFSGIAHVIAGADLALANLESPLTAAPHQAQHDHRLAADPAAARLLAAAGFDGVALANNHIGDSGPAGVADTLAAVTAAGLTPFGAGSDAAAAAAPARFEAAGLKITALAFDASGLGLAASGSAAGVAGWEEDAARDAVAEARRDSDIVIVSVHGVAPLAGRDRHLEEVGARLVDWGADVVWGHGAHVSLPIELVALPGRSAIVASGLGNFLFDQYLDATKEGLVLEVLVGAGGVIAYRVGDAEHPDRRVRFAGWREPDGAAALLGLEWWTVLDPPAAASAHGVDLGEWADGDLVDASIGDIDGDGRDDLVVAFRRPFADTIVARSRRDIDWADALGRSAHVGVYSVDGARQRWVAGSLLRPVARLLACDGALAVAYDTLDDPAIVAAGAWRWHGFGFMAGPDLDGAATLLCHDVDGDGRDDPLLSDRPGP